MILTNYFLLHVCFILHLPIDPSLVENRGVLTSVLSIPPPLHLFDISPQDTIHSVLQSLLHTTSNCCSTEALQSMSSCPEYANARVYS